MLGRILCLLITTLVGFTSCQVLWGVGSCDYAPTTPISFSTIDFLYTGNYQIRFNSSITKYPNLAIFNPSPLAADSNKKEIYTTAYSISHVQNKPIPLQVLLRADLSKGTVETTTYALQSTNTTLMLIPWMNLDKDDGRLFAVRITEQVLPNGNVIDNAYLDVINTGSGTFKQVWAVPNKLSTVYGGINYQKDRVTFPIFNYTLSNGQPQVGNWEFYTVDLANNYLEYDVAINTSAITRNQYPHNWTIISNLHFDNYTDQLIVAGNLDLNRGRAVWAGYLDPSSGIVTEKWSGSFVASDGEPLIVVYGSAFYEPSGILTLKLIDLKGDQTQAKLLTINTRYWTQLALVPFKIVDALCIETIVFI